MRFIRLAAPPEEPILSVAARLGSATVGLAIADLDPSGHAKVRSFFVEPDHHRKGIGSGLCAALEEAARDRGAKSIEAMFEATGYFGQAAEKIATKRGWLPSQPRTYVCRARCSRVQKSPFFQREMPPGYSTFLWKELSAAEREQIIADHAYPEALDPFAGPPFEPLNSLGLKKDGKVVGWMVTHRAGKVIRFSCLFVREEDRGTGLVLLAESINRAAAGGCDDAMFGVNHHNRTMIGVMSKHLRAYLDEYREIAYVALTLSS